MSLSTIGSYLYPVRNGCEKYANTIETGFNTTKGVAVATYQVGAGFVNTASKAVEIGVKQTAFEALKWTSGYTNFKDGVNSLFVQETKKLSDEDDFITRADKRTLPTRVGDMFGNFAIGGAKLWTAASYIQGAAISYGVASSNMTAEAVHAGINQLANTTYDLALAGLNMTLSVGLDISKNVALHPISSYETTKTVATVALALTCSYLLAKAFVKTYDTTTYVATSAKDVATSANNIKNKVQEKALSVANEVLLATLPPVPVFN